MPPVQVNVEMRGAFFCDSFPSKRTPCFTPTMEQLVQKMPSLFGSSSLLAHIPDDQKLHRTFERCVFTQQFMSDTPAPLSLSQSPPQESPLMKTFSRVEFQARVSTTP